VLLDAYRGLTDLAPLVMIGSQHTASSIDLPPEVIVARNVAHEDVMAAWAHSAVGVVPSLWPEPFGQVAVEAMAARKPVVASAIGGLPDVIVDGETGLLVPPGDPAALRLALRELLLDPARRTRMGEAGHERARLFTVGVVADRIEQLYHDICGKADPVTVQG